MKYIDRNNFYKIFIFCFIISLTLIVRDGNYKFEINNTNKSINTNYEKDNIILKVPDLLFGRNRIPTYTANIKTLDFNHVVFSFLVGDSIQVYEDWYIWDEMNDISFKEIYHIPNSTVSFRVLVYGHFPGQENKIADSIKVCNLEIVRFKLDSNGVASLVYLRNDIILNPDKETVKEYIQDKYGYNPNNLKTHIKKKLILVSPMYSQLFVEQAQNLFNQKKYFLALECMNDGLKLKPDDAKYLEYSGYLLAINGGYDEAIKNYEEAKRQYLKGPGKTIPASLYQNIGGTYLEKKDLLNAEKNLKKAIKMNPSDYLSYFDLGYLYELKRRFTQAVGYYKRALSIKHDYALAYKRIGIMYLYLGQIKLMTNNLNYAFNEYKKAYKKDPKDSVIIKSIGEIFYYYKESLNYFVKKSVKNPKDTNAYYNLGILYESLNNISPSKKTTNYTIFYFRKAAKYGHKEAKLWLKKNKYDATIIKELPPQILLPK